MQKMTFNPRRHQKRRAQMEVDAGLPWNKKMTVELGIETESEKQLQELLERQLCTTYTIKDHIDRRKVFANAGSVTCIPAEMMGTRTNREIRDLEKLQEQTLHLKCCGLDDDEIEFYLFGEKKKGNVSVDPSITKQKREAIEFKLKLYESSQESFTLASTGTGLKRLNRHQMELEKSLYVGCPQKDNLKHLIGPLAVDAEEPFRSVALMARRLASGPSPRSEKETPSKEATPVVQEKSKNRPDPSIFHAIVPLDKEDIGKNKFEIEDIKKIPRFKNYSQGVPSNVIYIKNLHSKVHVGELIALFGHFDTEGAPVRYRLLKGRFRGQAFATFKDVETAEAAFRLVNGYLLRDRPVILEFGKCNNPGP